MTTEILENSTDELTELIPYEDTDDGNQHLTHIVNPAMNLHIQQGIPMTSAEIVFAARMESKHVVALCGYKFVPKRNPEKYPACQACFDAAGIIMGSDG